MTNEELLARNAILDGVSIRYPYQDYEVAQQRYNRVMDALAEMTGWSRDKLDDYVKYSVIKSGKGGGAKLEAFFIGGKVSRHIDKKWLDAHVRNVTEVQVKWYLVEGEGQGHGSFIDAIYHARRGKFAGAFYDGKSARGRNEPGYRSVALCRQGADVHVTVKRYRGERTHVEGHVKGKVLRQIVNDATQRAASRNPSGNAEGVFSEVQYEAARRSARRFLRAIRSRGIALGEFFEGVSSVSWVNPIHEKEYQCIDAEEERQGAAFGEIEGFIGKADSQLSFLDGEE